MIIYTKNKYIILCIGQLLISRKRAEINMLWKKSYDKPRQHVKAGCCSDDQSCPTLCDPVDCSTPGIPVHHHFPELAQTHVHWVVTPPNHLVLYHPLLLLPPIFPSFRLLSNESVLHTKWPKYWSFSFSISPSNEYSGLISFKIDWFDLCAVQRTLKSPLQHHSSKASILLHSAFFMVQLLHPYMTIGNTIALIMQTFVDKVK